MGKTLKPGGTGRKRPGLVESTKLNSVFTTAAAGRARGLRFRVI